MVNRLSQLRRFCGQTQGFFGFCFRFHASFHDRLTDFCAPALANLYPVGENGGSENFMAFVTGDINEPLFAIGQNAARTTAQARGLAAWTASVLDQPSAQELSEMRDFAAECPGFSYLQAPDWPQYAPTKNDRHGYRWVLVRNAAGHIAMQGVLRQTKGPLGLSLGAFRRGPLTRTVEDLAPSLSILIPHLRRMGFVSVTLNPRWQDRDARDCETLLAGFGARPLAPARQTLHISTGLVDLRRPQDAIIRSFSSSCRTTIRKITRMPIQFRDIRDAEVGQFTQWSRAFLQSRGLNPNGSITPLAQIAHARAYGGVASAVELDGQVVGYVAALRDGDRILPIGNGWRDNGAKIPRDYIMFWHMIEQGKALGARWLDLGGLSSTCVERQTKNAERGSSTARDQFKLRFAPQIVQLTRVHEITLRPMVRNAADVLRKLR